MLIHYRLILFVTLVVSPLLAAPNPPTSLRLSPTNSTVTLHWDDNAWDESGYKIYRDGNLIAVTAKDVETFLDRGLSADTTYFYEVKATDDMPNAPYSLSKFQSVLDSSKLQWQSSITDEYKTIYNFEGVANEYFYLTEDSYMNFKTQSAGNKRVELRQNQTWDKWSGATMYADVRCYIPETIKEYTWMQVFDAKKKKPLLRLIWRASRSGKQNHLWAFLKTKDGEIKRDLGANPDAFFYIEVRVYHERVTLMIGDEVLLDEDVSHWGADNHFKAGVYLSGSANDTVKEGEKSALVQFWSLGYE